MTTHAPRSGSRVERRSDYGDVYLTGELNLLREAQFESLTLGPGARIQTAYPIHVRGALRFETGAPVATLDTALVRFQYETRFRALLATAEGFPHVAADLFYEAVVEGLWYVEELPTGEPLPPEYVEFLELCREFERGRATGAAVCTGARVVTVLLRGR